MNKANVDKNGFDSLFERVKLVDIPEYSGVRVMMLPVIIGQVQSIPDFIAGYKTLFEQMCTVERAKIHEGSIGYLTVDEKIVSPGTTHRREGAHVDGVYNGGAGGWGGGSGHTGGTWGSHGNGMLTVSSPAGCKAYNQRFEGWPGMNGESDHLMSQAKEENSVHFEPNMLYWLDGLCVHEPLPQPQTVERQFVRLSLPSNGPWLEGYTENPLGVKPTGMILPRREFM